MKVNWVSVQYEMTGNAAGYSRANTALLHAFRQAGGRHDNDAPISLHFCYPRFAKLVPGRRNILLTMFEYPELPRYFLDVFRQCDALIVPTTFCRDVFRPAFKGPIEVVPLGFDPERFPGVDRPDPAEAGVPFRFLWAGADNRRKGWHETLEAWRTGGFLTDPSVALTLKTQGGATQAAGNVVEIGNVTRDARLVSDQAMLRLYAEADCFVFPTAGEGFGLTLIEAMATALPCLAPLHTGMTDFCDSTTVIPLRTRPWSLYLAETDPTRGAGFKHVVSCNRVLVSDLIRKMRRVLRERAWAREIGLRACERVQTFTWAAAGVTLRETLERLAAQWGLAPLPAARAS